MALTKRYFPVVASLFTLPVDVNNYHIQLRHTKASHTIKRYLPSRAILCSPIHEDLEMVYSRMNLSLLLDRACFCRLYFFILKDIHFFIGIRGNNDLYCKSTFHESSLSCNCSK